MKCLIDKWFEMVNYAIGECDRLGLNFNIFVSPGRSHCGTPLITPEKGLKKLVTRDTIISGCSLFNAVVPKAPIVNGIEGDNQA